MALFLFSFTRDGNYPKKPAPVLVAPKVMLVPKNPTRPFTNDPIRFTLQADKQQVKVGEPIVITVGAHYLNISPASLFTLAGSTSFRLKVLLPEEFVQTGGDYADYIGTELSAAKPTATYTLKGYFTKALAKAEFRLLRGHGLANAQSLFVDKTRMSITVNPVDGSLSQTQRGARSAGPLAFQIVSYDCNSGNLQYQFTGGDGSPINVVLPGIFAGTVYSDNVATHTFPGDARQGRSVSGYANQSGNQIAITFTTSCNLTSGGTTNPPTTNPPSNPNPPTSGGNLAFQIVGYDCNSGVLQYQMTGGDGSPINVVLPGIFAGTVNANNLATHKFPSDARQGRSVSGYANQSGNQIAINFTTSCNLTSGGTTNPPSNPNPPSGGNLAFQIVSYDCNSGVLQYQFTGGNGSPIDVMMPGVFAGSVSANNITSYTFPSDAHTGRSVSGYANQSGNQIWISFTTSCNLTSGGTTNPPTSTCGTGTGLNGFYSNSSDLSNNLVAIRTDAQINFTWNASPIPGTVNEDGFSIRWIGQIEAPVSGNYTFKTYNDDGTRLWINKQLIINDWNNHNPTWQQGSIFLTGGQKYDIIMDFSDFSGNATAQLFWQYPGQNSELIPSCRLYPNKSSISSYGNPLAAHEYTVCIIDIGDTRFFTRCYNGQVDDVWEFSSAGNNSGNSGETDWSIGVNIPLGGSGAPGGYTNTTTPEIMISTDEHIYQSKFYPYMASKGFSFTNDEKKILETYPILKNIVRNYVDANNIKPDFITVMDQYLEVTYAFVTSPEERVLLANRPWQDQVAFRANAINASLDAVLYFDILHCQDNACNAFRHALFNALNAQSFTVAFARQLGQAREYNKMIDPDTFQPVNFVCDGTSQVIKEQYMDLYNNEWGYRAFYQYQAQGGKLSAIIKVMSDNGSLIDSPRCSH